MHALIDGDIPKYAIAFACQRDVYTDGKQEFFVRKSLAGMEVFSLETEETQHYPELRSKKAVLEETGLTHSRVDVDPIANCLHSVKVMIDGIVKASGATSYSVYLTQGECFRFKLSPIYKANRADVPKPVLIPEIQKYLISKYNAQLCTDIEADDALGIAQCQDPRKTIICTTDKDLDMIPGSHYNWNKELVYQVSSEQGLRFFWQQVLTGDSVDNIIGLKGVGCKTAIKLLADVPIKDCKEFCLNEYLKRDRTETNFILNCKLLWILRKPLSDTYAIKT